LPGRRDVNAQVRAVFIRRDDRRIVVQPFTGQPTPDGFGPVAYQGRVYVFSASLSAEHEGDAAFTEISPIERRTRGDLIVPFDLARAQRIAARARRRRFEAEQLQDTSASRTDL
jgi:hypothetical protein